MIENQYSISKAQFVLAETVPNTTLNNSLAGYMETPINHLESSEYVGDTYIGNQEHGIDMTYAEVLSN